MKVLLRASRTPFTILYNDEIPKKHYMNAYNYLEKQGTRNIGNLCFSDSVYKSLYGLNEIDIDRYEIGLDLRIEEEVDYINNEYDMFILPMCVFGLHLLQKEYLSNLTKLIKKLKIPCIVVGIAAHMKLNKDTSHLKKYEKTIYDFFSSILDKSNSIGVRGEITKEYLVSIGLPKNSIDVIGCPSMFYNGDKLKITKKDLNSIVITVSDINKDERNNVLKFIDYCNKNYTNKIYITQTRYLMKDIYESKFPIKENINIPPNNHLYNFYITDRIKFFCDFIPWLNYLKQQSFTIGTRIHGNIMGLLAGIPAHVIAHDCRTLELAEYFEIPYTLSKNIDKLNIKKLYKLLDYSSTVKNHKKRLDKYKNFLEKNNIKHNFDNIDIRNDFNLKLKKSLKNTILL